VLGVAYKPDVSDVRESPALKIIARLRRSGADVAFHDPHVDAIDLDDGPLGGVDLDEGRLRDADLVAVVTNHSSYAWDELARHARLILDTRNALAGVEGRIVRL
jgi:UDP-N-acetyl-D-glucosamine dehydrogenase